MKTCFSTFITGFEKVVEKRLPVDLNGLKKVKKIADGLIIYQTKEQAQKIKSLRYFNNSFLLIQIYESASLEGAMHLLANDKALMERIANDIKHLGRSFRVVFTDENKIVSLGNKAKDVENAFSGKVVLDKANPDTELWFIKRKEGAVYLGLRLTRTDEEDKHLHKGQLRHELAHLLCLLSEPEQNDIFLDPFAGYGAIVMERIISFPYTKVIAGEKDKQIFKLLQEKLKGKTGVVVGRWDATDLSSLTDGSVNKIVTDPPWGIYSNNMGLDSFYIKILQEFTRVLKKGGLAVVLTAQKELFEQTVQKCRDLLLTEKLNCLVSGKKASAYKLKKI
jgi:tRNA G10  N-methylase Trm11